MEVRPSIEDDPKERRARLYEFGPFRIDTARRVLMREGEPVSLAPKVFDTLLLLIENSGQLVSKDYLISNLWPDTFVEETGLTRNISVLRKALDESPRKPLYIVTIPGEGYRFIGDVKEVATESYDAPARTDIAAAGEATGHQAEIESVSEPQSYCPTILNKKILVAAAILIAAAVVFLIYKIIGGTPTETALPSSDMEITNLTNTGNVLHAALSPDGKYVAYSLVDTPQTNSLWIRQLATPGSTQIISPSETEYRGMTFSRDSSYIYYTAREKNSPMALYRIPLLGGPPKKIIEGVDSPVSFSPDGRQFVFFRSLSARRESLLVVADEDGSREQVVSVLKSPEYFGPPAWSPDGKVIACAAGHDDGGLHRYVAEISVGEWKLKPVSEKKWMVVGSIAWLSDGKGLLVNASDHPSKPTKIWHLAYPDGKAKEITNNTYHYNRMSLSADSRTLIVVQVRLFSNMWMVPADDPSRAEKISFGSGGYRGGLSWTPDNRIVYESITADSWDISLMNSDGSNQKQVLGEMTRSAITGSPNVSPDGRYMVFSSDLKGARNIWRIDIDGTNPLQLTYGKGEDRPSFSPDGRWVLYTDIISHTQTLWKVPVEGGEPVQLTTRNTRSPVVSPDGKFIACLYFDEQSPPRWKMAVLPFEGGDFLKTYPQPLRYDLDIFWTPDGRSLTYVDERDIYSNIWIQPIEGGNPRQLTDFKGDLILGFGWSRDGKQLACARGLWERNLVLIKNFR